jgi:hypothetical protein
MSGPTPSTAYDIQKLLLRHEPAWRESYCQFVRVIQDHRLETGIEVGVAFGGHVEAMLDGAEVELIGVDPYQHIPHYDDPLNLPQETFDQLFWFTMGRLHRFGNRYTHLRATSQQAAGLLNFEVDFVYLDADHSRPAVAADLAMWYPKVRAGGIIGGHDYGYAHHPGVKEAVDEFCERQKLSLHVEPATVWWTRKPAGEAPAASAG